MPEYLVQFDWRSVLLPQTPLLEIAVRGTIVYLFLVILFRLVVRREIGEMGISDVLVIVLIADASQNAMADGYQSVADGLILVSVIAFWAYFVDWLTFHSPAFERLSKRHSVVLVRGGRVMRHNLRHALVSHLELMEHLREQGYASLDDVETVRMESDGRISVIAKGAQGQR